MQIADAHNDLLMSFNSTEDVQDYLQFCENNKVVKVFTAYYLSQAMEKLDSEKVFQDIEQKFKLLPKSKMVVRSFENIGFVRNEADLEKLLQFQPKCVTLTWNYVNGLAGGALSNDGVTDFGFRTIKRLIDHKIIIDTAHLNEKSFYQYIENFDEPIFCSHTASKQVYNYARNLSNAQLVAIQKSGGFVGLCLYNKLLSDDVVDFTTIRRHLDTMLEFAGAECVGFGTDFNGTGEQNPVGFDFDYQGMQPLYDYLAKFYDSATLQKVFYRNLTKVIKKL